MSVLALTSDSVANRYPIDRIWRHHIDWLWCRVMSIRNVCRNRTSVFRIMPSIEMPFLIVLNWLRYQKFKYKVKKKLKVFYFYPINRYWNYNKADEENFLKSHQSVLMALYLNIYIYGSFVSIRFEMLWKRRIWYNIERYTFPCNYVCVITQVIFEQILIRVRIFIQYSNSWRKFYTSWHLLEERLNSTWFSILT